MKLDGAVESAVRLGVADAVADVVSTGSTLVRRPRDLRPGHPRVDGTAHLDRRDDPGIDVLRRRLQGVLVARGYVMLDYDIPTGLLEQATAVASGIESPTVSPLHDRDWSACG